MGKFAWWHALNRTASADSPGMGLCSACLEEHDNACKFAACMPDAYAYDICRGNAISGCHCCRSHLHGASVGTKRMKGLCVSMAAPKHHDG